MNKSVYLARLGMMKEYGFDFIRLHSHFEAPAFFEAADELGIFISAALPAGGCKLTLQRTWEWQINALRNTPSVLSINMANEAYGVPPTGYRQQQPNLAPIQTQTSNPNPDPDQNTNPNPSVGGWPGALFPWRAEFYTRAKQINPSMHVIDTDGCCWAETGPNKSAVQELTDGPPICPAPFANGSCARFVIRLC
jgi:hypothetical protein